MSEIKFLPSNPGTPTVPKYRSVVMKDGDIKLIPDGKRFLNEEIQSFADECDINCIVRRYMAGDVNALGSVQGTYADLMKAPQTRQEALQSMIDARAIFDDLPAEIRGRFGNSWESFYVCGDSEEVAKAIMDAYGTPEDSTPPSTSAEASTYGTPEDSTPPSTSAEASKE